MKYYLIEISEGNSKIRGKAVYEYDTLHDAVASFHSKMGVAMKSELYTSELLMVINSEGGVYENSKYVAESVQVEPVDAFADAVAE